MDEIVKQAMLKWPNVPHCYGWLALDARGAWRMRDEHAQHQNLPGDKIMHAALIDFINRNYTNDEQGQWYFQNGPQRVYVNLALTPYIARTDPTLGFMLQTNQPLTVIDSIFLTSEGRPLLVSGSLCAALDDRDIAQCMISLYAHNKPITAEHLLAWLTNHDDNRVLTWQHNGKMLPVQRIAKENIATHFGFVPQPRQR